MEKARLNWVKVIGIIGGSIVRASKSSRKQSTASLVMGWLMMTSSGSVEVMKS